MLLPPDTAIRAPGPTAGILPRLFKQIDNRHAAIVNQRCWIMYVYHRDRLEALKHVDSQALLPLAMYVELDMQAIEML
jgi:hypothetical protein